MGVSVGGTFFRRERFLTTASGTGQFTHGGLRYPPANERLDWPNPVIQLPPSAR